MGELRPYQVDMVNAVRQAYRAGAKRPCLVLPCGGGKSVITADMAKKANVGQLWLTHFSPSLIRAEDYMPAVRKIFPESYLGKDGKCIELVFQEE